MYTKLPKTHSPFGVYKLYMAGIYGYVFQGRVEYAGIFHYGYVFEEIGVRF